MLIVLRIVAGRERARLSVTDGVSGSLIVNYFYFDILRYYICSIIIFFIASSIYCYINVFIRVVSFVFFKYSIFLIPFA
jgi:hypothetical protein